MPFDLAAGDAVTKDVPKTPAVPAALALKMIAGDMTAWQLFKAIEEYEDDRDQTVLDLLAPIKTWALAAACKAHKLTVTLHPLVTPSKILKSMFKLRMTAAVGQRPSRAPDNRAPPTFDLSLTAKQAAEAAAASMLAAREHLTAPADGNTFQRGIEYAFRLHEQSGSNGTKGLSNIRKGALMGWTRSASWDQVPDIWDKLAKCRTWKDAKILLEGAFALYLNDVDRQVIEVLWIEDLVKAIMDVDLAPQKHATFLSSMQGLSILLFLAYTPDEVAEIRREEALRGLTEHNLDIVQARKELKAPRLPPRTFADLTLLLTTYAIVLRMLFDPKKEGRNAHLEGVNSVRQQLFLMRHMSHKVDAMYCAQVVWAVLCDAFMHFSECTSIEDCATSATEDIVWPQTDLHAFADRMRAKDRLDDMTFPAEWRAAVAARSEFFAEREGGFGSYGGASGAPGRGMRIGDRRGTMGLRLGDATARGSPGTATTPTAKWVRDHSDRYARSGGGTNPDPSSKLVKLLKPLRDTYRTLQWKMIFRQLGTGMTALGRVEGCRETLCCKFATGECPDDGCQFAHKTEKESPNGYEDWLYNQLKPAVKHFVDQIDEPTSGEGTGDKRRKKSSGPTSAGKADE